MKTADIVAWVQANKWLVVFALVLFAGYSVGKDAALRDNARDTRQRMGAD